MKIHLKDSSESQNDELESEYDVEPNPPPVLFANRAASTPGESPTLGEDGVILEALTST